MAESKILYAEKDTIYWIKMIGEIKHNISANFDSLVDRIFRNHSLENIVIDLTETKYIDSTNLGLLAKVARQMLENFGRKATIVSTNEDINQVLDSMGFSQVFLVVRNPKDFVEDLKEIPSIAPSGHEKMKLILQAHKEIMEMNDHNKAVFKNVVEVLEMEQKKSED